MVWRRQAADGRELRIRFDLAAPERWIVQIEGDRREYRSPYLRAALADAADVDVRAPWIIALEDQLRAHLRDSPFINVLRKDMEGYQVVTVDEKKVGNVLGTSGDFVIVEHGHLQKSRHAVPREATHVDDDRQEVRLSVSKQTVLESPKIGKAGEFDGQAVAAHYGYRSQLA
jgi:hypothetical protein